MYQPVSGSGLTVSWFLIFTHSPLTSSASLPSASQLAYSLIEWPSFGPTPQ